jgi:pimeloyl-ACP methyl ester carboxylesterase
MHHQEWGDGDPLIALHPLALESTAFAGAAREFAKLGLRTLAVDLPGFGKTPIVEGALTPAVLARPVIELAKSLERPPILLGMSLGGRVALEVALHEPQCVRGLVMVAPYLPWRHHRRAVEMAEQMDPEWAYHLPLERAWPLLQHTSLLLDALPALEHDWFARACVRVAYYLTCPATRVAFLSAARELAIDPAYGPDGTWTRLANLEVPTTFLWAGRDRLIPSTHAEDVAAAVPHVPQLEVACSGHFVNFVHYRCMEKAMALAVSRVLEIEEREAPIPDLTLTPCLAGQSFEEERPLEMVEFDDGDPIPDPKVSATE